MPARKAQLFGYPVVALVCAGAAYGRHRRVVRRLEALALTDELTGLPNRRAWNDQLPRELSRARRGGQPVTVALVDLDRFKAFNDRFGHDAGDRLLRGVADQARGCLRRTDLMARYGGEEFAVVLPGASLDRAQEVIDRFRRRIPSGGTYSAGIACWDGKESPEDLLSRADKALYEAKARGRAQTIRANSQPDHLLRAGRS